MATQEPTQRSKGKWTDEVWLCIRAVYESDSEMSVEDILKFVKQELDVESLPRRSSVQSRADREGWQRPQNLRQKTESELIKVMNKARKEALFIDEENKDEENQYIDDSQLHDDDYIERRDASVSASIMSVKKLLSNSVKRKRKVAEVVRRDREMVERLQDIVEHVMDELIIHKTLMLSEDFKKVAYPEDMERVERTYGVNLGLVEPVLFMSNAVEKLVKMRIVLFGITPEDTREPETAGRVKDLEDPTAYIEQQKRLLARNKELAARRRYIESGGLDADVAREMNAKMQELGLNDDDISEAEFEEIDD